MTVQIDLQTALDAYIQSQFQGTLPEISASKIPLADLLKIQQALAIISNSAIAPVGAHTTNSTLNASVTLTPPLNASRILLQAFTQNVRFLFTETSSATVPTASVGFRLLAGERINLSVPTGSLLKVIEETASASIQYQWVM